MKFGILCTEIYETAKKIENHLLEKYDCCIIKNEKDILNIDTLIVLGGDGFMLRVLHNYYKYNKPFFGINCGNVGFLLNNFDYYKIDLQKIVENSKSIVVNPLKSEIVDLDGNNFVDVSFNELTLIRNVYKTCNLNIKIDGKYRMENYSGDGIVVSTPIGSTAYNSSIGGAIIPHKSNNIILSTISPFRPRTFKSVILQNDSVIEFEVNYKEDRRISAFSDHIEYKNIRYAKTNIDKNIEVKLLFDERMTFEEKIIEEQFR